MSLHKLLSFTVLLLLSTLVWGQQTVIKGKITDEETDEGLPFATAIFTGTTIGVTTDLDGYFELKTNDLELKSITLSYLGYEPKEAKINPGKLNEKEYKLKAVKLELDVVEVKAKRRIPKDTAAIELFRNVVANKYRNDPSSYEYLSYKQYAKTEFGFYDVSQKFKDSKIIKRWSFVLDNMDTTENGIEVLPVLLK
ncbi:MAG: carboxypeptidase-like regulatory domain-containing protein, partial [Chitinophagales bacterium]